MNTIYVLTLIAGLASLTGAVDELDELCLSGKDCPKITQISDVRAIIDLIRSDDLGVKYLADVKAAILALEPVIELKSVCSREATDTIVGFWLDYCQTKPKGSLPKLLREFVLGFGLQVSRLCKRTMMNELRPASRGAQLSAEDIRIVSGPVLMSVGKVFPDYKVENLLAIIQTDTRANGEKRKISMEPKQRKFFELLRERCVHKFEPIYNTLIAPIVRLASIGMNYVDESIAKDMSVFERDQLYKNWFAAVLACEASSRFIPVDIPKKKIDSDGKTQQITFLDEEDLYELSLKTGLSLEEEPAIGEPVDYKVDREVQVDNLVIDEANTYLVDSIYKYQFTMSSVNKYYLRMIKKIPSLMGIYMEQEAIKFGLLPIADKRRTQVRSFGEKLWGWTIVILGSAAAGMVVASVVSAVITSHGLLGPVLVVMAGILILTMIASVTFVGSVGYLAS